MLEHGGDFSAATRQLASQGYGNASEGYVNLSGFLNGLAKTGTKQAKTPSRSPNVPAFCRLWAIAQAFVADHLATYVDFPPRQKPGSFGLDQVLSKLQESSNK